MSIISWNVRGAVGADFRRVFKEMVISYRPDLVILMETKFRGDKANSVISSLGLTLWSFLEASGFFGTPIQLWSSQSRVLFISYSSKFK